MKIGGIDQIIFASNIMWHIRDIFIAERLGLISQIRPDH